MKIRCILKMMMLAAMLLGIHTSAVAALITGGMGMTGNYSTSGGTDLSDATDITLNSFYATSGSGDIGDTVGFGTPGTVNNGSFSFASFSSVTNLLTIGGWQLDLTTLNITDQTTSLLTMEGTGVLSGNGFENTLTDWTYSSQSASSYSMSVTSTGTTVAVTTQVSPVPVPASVWLFASGFIGLIGVARRKALRA